MSYLGWIVGAVAALLAVGIAIVARWFHRQMLRERALLAEVDARQGELVSLDGLSFDLAVTARALAAQQVYGLVAALLARPPACGAGTVVMRFVGAPVREEPREGITRASVTVPGLTELACPACARLYPGPSLMVERDAHLYESGHGRIIYAGLCPELHPLRGFRDYMIVI